MNQEQQGAGVGGSLASLFDDISFSTEDETVQKIKSYLEPLSEQVKQFSMNEILFNLKDKKIFRTLKQKQEFTQYLSARNFKEEYKQLKQIGDQSRLITIFSFEQFWEQDVLPDQIQYIVEVLSRLNKQKFFHFLEIAEYSCNRIDLNSLQLLKILLQIKYSNTIQNDDQKQLEQLIGSYLNNQIYELENFILIRTKQNYSQYNEAIENLQRAQKSQDFQCKGKHRSFDFLYQLFVIKENLSSNLDFYIKQTLSISSAILDYEIIINQFEEFLKQDGDFDEFYFKLIVYYWGQYCDNFIKSKSQILQIIDGKLIFLSKFWKLQEEKKQQKVWNSKIPAYFLDRFILYDEQDSLIIEASPFQQSQMYRQQQVSAILDILFEKQENLMKLKCKVDELTFYNLNSFETGNLFQKILLKILWMNNKEDVQLYDFLQVFYNIRKNLPEYLTDLKVSGQCPNYLKQDLIALKILKDLQKNKLDQQVQEKSVYLSIQTISKLLISRLNCFNEYPKNLNIKLEDFHYSLVEYTKDLTDSIIDNWVKNTADEDAFRGLIPFYFNILKRSESAQKFVNSIEESFQRQRIPSRYLNMNSLFQILYNNSNEELKMMLVKLYSKSDPVPLLYENIQIEEINPEFDLFSFNHHIYYIFPKCYSIISFSLCRQNTKCGKSDLLNKMFYGCEKFAVNGQCQFTRNTVQIMFDFVFGHSRKLAVADVNGFIPLTILIKLLSLFNLWIIQVPHERQLEKTVKTLTEILSQIRDVKPIITLIVRDSDKHNHENEESIQIMQNQYISTLRIKDLRQGIENIDSEIKKVQKFVFSKIYENDGNRGSFKTIKHKNFKNKRSFIQVAQLFCKQDIIQELNDAFYLIQDLKKELARIQNLPMGFFEFEAFPIRSIEETIENLKKEIADLGIDKPYDREIDNKLKQMVKTKQEKIGVVDQTELLKIFQSIFRRKDYYRLYQLFIDAVQKINKKFQDASEKQKLKFQTISIEVFWRESILQKQKVTSRLIQFDPTHINYELLKKGESVELIDGDNFQINQNFIKELIQQFHVDKERVVILSSLGLQSAGKSTVLNKLFGCHFMTYTGKTTKGINMQLLKVSNQSLFQNAFNDILLLDTEGLSNSDQKDEQFDQKITLLVLAISNLILFVIQGDLTKKERKLIESCVTTITQLSNSFPSLKQLFFCFNQIIKTDDIKPFQLQIEPVVGSIKQSGEFQDNSAFVFDGYLQLFGIATESVNVCQSWDLQQSKFKFSEDIGQSGIQILTQFAKQLQEQQLNLYGINNFVSEMCSTWNNIQKRPELLEFADLEKKRQDLKTRDIFENLWKEAKDEKAQRFNIQIIVQEYMQNQILSVEVDFQFLKEQIVIKIKSELNTMKESIQVKFKDICENQSISDSIKDKYLDQLNIKIQQEILQYSFILLEEIEQEKVKNLENIFSYNLNPQNSNQQFVDENSEQNIRQFFDRQWNQSTQQFERQFESIYIEFDNNFLKMMSLAQLDADWRTVDRTEHLKFLRGTFNKLEPRDEEKPPIYEKIPQDLLKKEGVVFDLLSNKRHQQLYSVFFDNDFQDRINLLRGEQKLIQVNCFSEMCPQYICVLKEDIQNYLSKNLIEDLITLVSNKQIDVNEMKDFFSILKLLEIHFNQEELDHYIKKILDLNGKSNSRNSIIQLCRKFFGELRFTNEIKRVLENENFALNHQIFYRSLNYQIQDLNHNPNDRLKFLSDIPNTHVAIAKGVIFKANCQPDHRPCYEYIISPQNFSQYKPQFLKLFPEIFTNLMLESQDGWKNLYSIVYQSVKEQVFQEFQRNMADKLQSISLQSFSFFQSKLTFELIAGQIRGFQKEFAFFGLSLSGISEKIIKYFTLLMIWRFNCYFKWKRLEEHKVKKQVQKSETFDKFSSNLKKNRQQLSIIRAQQLFEKICSTFQNQSYKQLRPQVTNALLENKMSSKDLIQQLDNELWATRLQTDEAIYYIQNQRAYLNKQVDKKITEKKKNAMQLSQNYFNKEMKQFSELLQFNIDLLIDKYQYQDDKQDAKYFFEDKSEVEEGHMEKLLYEIVLNCLQGKQPPHLNLVTKECRQVFQQKFAQVAIPFDNENSENQQIQQFSPFLKELKQKLNLISSYKNVIALDFKLFNVQKEVEDLTYYMRGCQEVCPGCNRKCDADCYFIEGKHTHSCSNGHQIRGFNKVLYQGRPSLYTCEQLNDGDYINFVGTQIIIKWREFKLNYKEWDFDEGKQNRLDLTDIWNGLIGQQICKQLKIDYPIKEKDQRYYYLYEDKLNFIIAIEDSKQMLQGNKSQKCIQQILNLMKYYSRNDVSRLSVILYNNKADVVIDNQVFNYPQQEKKITLKMEENQVDFSLACDQIHSQITKIDSKHFLSHFILIHMNQFTSSTTLERLCNLPDDIRNKIILRIYTYGEYYNQFVDNTIPTIKDKFKSVEKYKYNVPEFISEIWSEKIDFDKENSLLLKQ